MGIVDAMKDLLNAKDEGLSAEDDLMMAMVEEGIAEYEEPANDDDTLTLTEEQRVEPTFIRPAKPVVTTKDLDRANMLANR